MALRKPRSLPKRLPGIGSSGWNRASLSFEIKSWSLIPPNFPTLYYSPRKALTGWPAPLPPSPPPALPPLAPAPQRWVSGHPVQWNYSHEVIESQGERGTQAASLPASVPPQGGRTRYCYLSCSSKPVPGRCRREGSGPPSDQGWGWGQTSATWKCR